MKNSSKTAAASEGSRILIDLGIDRVEMGFQRLKSVLSWTAVSGIICEPESKILIGKTGMLKRYATQGYFKQILLPPGLKAAHHFPHKHYFQLTEKGILTVSHHCPELIGLGNLKLRQGTYYHDFIGRMEAAWRIKMEEIISYLPEARLPGLSAENQKQHDGHWILVDGSRVGVEIEAADWKSGNKLAMFTANCLNSITEDRVQRICILTQSESAMRHYAKPFAVGETYFAGWLKQSGKWWPRQSSRTVITRELSEKVKVGRILTKSQIDEKFDRRPISVQLASPPR